jgi:hypothetical protein
MRRVLPKAKSLVDEAGMPRLGVFAGEFENLNIYDSALRISGIPLPKSAVRFRTKEWFHAAVITPEAYIGFAVVNMKFLGMSFVSFTKRDGTGAFEHRKQGLASKASVPVDMLHSRGGFSSKGYEFRVETGLDSGRHAMELNVKPSGKAPAVDLKITGFEDPAKIAAMVVSMPVGSARAAYSHKCVIPCEGSLVVGCEELLGEGKMGLMVIDFHRALYPRHTFWRWATFAGWGDDGMPVGLNLTKNVVVDDWEYNENCFWEGGKMHLLGPAVFEFDHRNVMLPWKIKSADGAVELVFKPLCEKGEKVNAGIIADNFKQVYGTFSGTVSAGGKQSEIRDLFGVCERHDAIW